MEDYEEYDDDDQEDLESRVSDLEERVGNAQSNSGAGCVVAIYSLGASLSVVLSWHANHSVLWAILHGLLSWLYVIYFVFAH